MGLILDSSVLIAAERKGKNARQALADIAVSAAGEDGFLTRHHGVLRNASGWRRPGGIFSLIALTGLCARIHHGSRSRTNRKHFPPASPARDSER
jgi:hypothetical protein